MDRLEQLNTHLSNLIGLNANGGYETDIKNTLDEINAELGIGKEARLASYSTKELHEELVKRESVKEFVVTPQDEVLVSISTGDVESANYSLNGPVRILVNRD